MSLSHFPQYEHELFWVYYGRLHDFIAPYGSCLEKWEILHIVYEGVNCDTRALLEHWDFCAKNVDEAYDFLDWLARDTYEFETCCANSFIPPPCIPDYAPPMCEICHCPDHDSSSCPYYISDEGFARISNMIETMNEQQIEFAKQLREYDLSHETDIRFSSPSLDVKLCDDGASFHPLGSELEEVRDPPLHTSPTVAPSSPSTFRNNTAFTMTFLDTPSPLAQSTEFEVGETFGISAGVDEDDTWSELGNAFIEEYDLHDAPIGTSCVDVVVAGLASPDLVASISPDHLDASNASLPYSPPSPSPEYCAMPLIASYVILEGDAVDYSETLGTFRGYKPSLDPYNPYLEHSPGKIVLTIAFDYFTDFPKAFGMFRSALIIMSVFIFVCSYLHSSELHAQAFDKLLRALTASALKPRVLSNNEEWLMLLAPPIAPSSRGIVWVQSVPNLV